MTTVIDKPYRIERCCPVESERLLHRLKAGRSGGYLSPIEMATVIGFTSDKRRQDWLAGRLATKRLMQTILAEEGTRLTLPEIEVLNHESGAPYVRIPGHKEYLRRHLSISHTSTCAAAAVAQPGHRVGIDVEIPERRAMSFLELISHPDERDFAFLNDPHESTRVWTLKESVSKVLGTGLSVGFWDIRFPATTGKRKLEFYGAARVRWEQLGKPVIHFESFVHQSNILSVAYTTGDAHA